MAEDGIPLNPIIAISSPEASGSIPASIDTSVNLNATTNNNKPANEGLRAPTPTPTDASGLKPSPKPDRAAEGTSNGNGNGVVTKRRPSLNGQQQPKVKQKEKKKFLRKKELTGVAVRGEHLLRLVQTTRLNRQQILQIANKFYVFAPSGVMSQAEFNKALEFDKDDAFANRLFVLFESEKHSGNLYMDDFITGLSKIAPDTDINTKLDLCYELFDVDGNGGVNISEFREMTKYSMRHGRFGIDEEKLNKIVDLQWKQLDFGGDNIVSRDEFKTVLMAQKAFVNSLTLQVPWLQAAFRMKPLSTVAQYEYLGTEPLEMIIRDVAKQLNASDEDINKWSKILRKNLYHDVKSLKEIDSTDWTSMDLPRRLFSAVHSAIEPDHQTNSQIMEGRVKHNVASSRNHRLRIFLETHKSSIMFFTLYFLGNCAMLAWTLTKYLTRRVGDKYYNQADIIGPSFVISRSAGALAKYNFALMLFPVCYRTMTWMRSSVLEHFLPIDVAMKFHRRVGAWILFLGLVHMAAHCVNFLRLSRQGSPTELAAMNAAFGFNFASAPSQAALHGTRTGVTGWLMVGLMLLLVLLAIERVRRSNFRLFFTIHHLYIPIICLLVIHDGLINPIEIVYWMIPSIALFLLERAVTVYRGVPQYQVLEGTRILKGDVLALHIQKPIWFKYSAGHYLWINCPTISGIEWHPFTLTSSPDEEFLMVDINCTGDWTKKLKDLYAKHLTKAEKKGKKKEEIEIDMDSTTSSPPQDIPPQVERKGISSAEEAEVMAPIKGKLLPQLRLDGPYGTASGDVLLFTHVLLVGGGIGVTPFISILKSIRHAVLYKNDCPLHAVHFIWVTKNQENFQWFSMMLADLQRHEDLRGFLKVSIYLTGPRHPINDIRLLGVSLLMNKAKEELNEDLVTGLEGDTYFGRPDFSKILLQHNKEWAGNDVGVFFCGPEPLAQAIQVTCRALNHANQIPIGRRQVKKGARFFFKQEHF